MYSRKYYKIVRGWEICFLFCLCECSSPVICDLPATSGSFHLKWGLVIGLQLVGLPMNLVLIEVPMGDPDRVGSECEILIELNEELNTETCVH